MFDIAPVISRTRVFSENSGLVPAFGVPPCSVPIEDSGNASTRIDKNVSGRDLRVREVDFVVVVEDSPSIAFENLRDPFVSLLDHEIVELSFATERPAFSGEPEADRDCTAIYRMYAASLSSLSCAKYLRS